MVFSDPAFLAIFLPLSTLAILLCARFAHSFAMLFVSLAFYFWSSGSIVLVLTFSIVFNWYWALRIHRHKSPATLALGISVNLIILFYYKYAIFFAEQLGFLFAANLEGVFQDIILPVGISFFTFQAVSYLVDVHRGDTEPETNVIRFGAYLSFFPQLIAGPIIRFKDVISQYVKPEINLPNMSAGFTRFCHGLLKKVVVADSAGALADACFSLPVEQYGLAVCWLGAIAYTVQIYFDFSGYSDMAIGLGLIFGVRFNENFVHPYSASSITEFWRRWHISLSTWFRDYLYIPLGGNRNGTFKTYRNLLVIFIVTGLWHGAAWTFVVWGIYHGLFLIVERLALGGRAGSERSILWRYCYLLPVVIVGWMIFRADSLEQGLTFIQHLWLPTDGGLTLPDSVLQIMTPFTLYATVAGCCIFLARRNCVWGAYLGSIEPDGKLVWLRLAYCLVGFPVALILAFSSDFSPFLYFRF